MRGADGGGDDDDNDVADDFLLYKEPLIPRWMDGFWMV